MRHREIKKLKKNIFKNNAGFSLLEVMVAISIMTVGLGGAMALITMSMNAGVVSSDRLVAANLAQEGIEVVRSIRDINYTNDSVRWQTWYDNISNGTYSVQFDSQDFGSSYGTPLYYHTSAGRYDYNAAGGIASPYKRSIILTRGQTDGSGKLIELKVVCVVTWKDKSIDKSLTVEERLWNWWR